jgi:hypothetical protein
MLLPSIGCGPTVGRDVTTTREVDAHNYLVIGDVKLLDVVGPEIREAKKGFVRSDRPDIIVMEALDNPNATFSFDVVSIMSGMNGSRYIDPLLDLPKGKICVPDFSGDGSIDGQRGAPCGKLVLSGRHGAKYELLEKRATYTNCGGRDVIVYVGLPRLPPYRKR